MTGLQVIAQAPHGDITIVQYETGAIRICRNGKPLPVVVKDTLRPIAIELGIDLLNGKGGVKKELAREICTAGISGVSA